MTPWLLRLLWRLHTARRARTPAEQERALEARFGLHYWPLVTAATLAGGYRLQGVHPCVQIKVTEESLAKWQAVTKN